MTKKTVYWITSEIFNSGTDTELFSTRESQVAKLHEMFASGWRAEQPYPRQLEPDEIYPCLEEQGWTDENWVWWGEQEIDLP